MSTQSRTPIDDVPPSGEERQVERLSIATIDGAPLAYVVSLAAVVAVLAMIPIPISVVLSSGRNFPMSQSIYPLVGWLLGPVAGALADAIGALIGVFVAPQTTTYAPATIFGAAMGGLAAAVMHGTGPRRHWWLPVSVLLIGLYALYAGRAIFVNHASWISVTLGSFIDWSALLLFVLPTRWLIARLIRSDDLTRTGVGLAIGTWTVAGLVHLSTATIIYSVQNWPNEIWVAITPLAPLEHAVRCLAGTAIGLGVISGLRATGVVKPIHANY